MQERRSDYIELGEIKVQLATIIERLGNTIAALENHVEADKEVEHRVSALETYKANIFGVIIGATATGSVVGYFIAISGKYMGGH